ncbi:MAG: hypothetical protein Q8S24_13605, partial [Eubacteriales bacterium]|nr:hypothetical protein [Eubacteriales bacterium]
EIYQNHNMDLDISKVYVSMHINHYCLYDFSKCKHKLDLATEAYANSVTKDSIHEINLLYHKVDLLALTHSDFNQAIKIVDSAISLSLENNMYFLERLYRLKALLNFQSKDYREFKSSIEKSLILCKTSNMSTKVNVYLAMACGENYFGNYSNALDHTIHTQKLIMQLLNFDVDPSKEELFINRVMSIDMQMNTTFETEQLYKQIYSCLIEKAIAYHYLNDTRKAIALLASIDFDFFLSKFTLIPNRAYFWENKLSYSKILSHSNKTEEAIKIATEIKDHLLEINDFYDLYKTYELLGDLYKKMNDYENAFISLHSAHQFMKENMNFSFDM